MKKKLNYVIYCENGNLFYFADYSLGKVIDVFCCHEWKDILEYKLY